jgi:hypothetical protein
MRKAVLVVGVVLLVLAAGLLLLRASPISSLVLQQSPGPFDRPRWEAVVRRVDALGLMPGETRELRLDNLDEPMSLRPLRPGEGQERGRGAGNVWAQKTPDGKLKVVIETRDLGHAGEYGFAYSEVPLSPTAFGGDWLSLDVPGRLQLALPSMQIDDRWWEVVYNLD